MTRYASRPIDTGWRTSFFSNGGDNCVEVTFTPDDQVGVRDTKDRGAPPHVNTRAAWLAFLAAVASGEFAV